MAEWTTDAVANRFEDAARTARRLPAVRVQGYFNVWPTIVRTPYERLAGEDPPVCRFVPTPQEVQQMLEVMKWVQWLDVEQRKLVWMRAERYRWDDIARRFGCATRTAQRRCDAALHLITRYLNKGVDRRCGTSPASEALSEQMGTADNSGGVAF